MRKIRAGQRRPGTIFCRTVKIELDEALKTCYDMQANLRDASVAQSVEQLIRNQQVAGSSPASSSRKGTCFCRCFFFFYFACCTAASIKIKTAFVKDKDCLWSG